MHQKLSKLCFYILFFFMCLAEKYFNIIELFQCTLNTQFSSWIMIKWKLPQTVLNWFAVHSLVRETIFFGIETNSFNWGCFSFFLSLSHTNTHTIQWIWSNSVNSVYVTYAIKNVNFMNCNRNINIGAPLNFICINCFRTDLCVCVGIFESSTISVGSSY